MSTPQALHSAAEIQKLAHTLGVPPADLDALAGVPAADLRTLRAQIGEYLFQVDKHHFTKVATLSKAVPIAVAAKLTEHVLPPLLAARTAELLDPERAVDLVARISDGYLADVSAAMDPGRSPRVIAKIPADRVSKVAMELARREEWVVMGGFVAHVSPDALAAAVRSLNGEQLLRIGFVLDDLSRLDQISAMLTDAQLDQLLAAASVCELWRELEDLLANIADERVARLAERFAQAPADVGAAAREAAGAGKLSRDALGRLTA